MSLSVSDAHDTYSEHASQESERRKKISTKLVVQVNHLCLSPNYRLCGSCEVCQIVYCGQQLKMKTFYEEQILNKMN